MPTTLTPFFWSDLCLKTHEKTQNADGFKKQEKKIPRCKPSNEHFGTELRAIWLNLAGHLPAKEEPNNGTLRVDLRFLLPFDENFAFFEIYRIPEDMPREKKTQSIFLHQIFFQIGSSFRSNFRSLKWIQQLPVKNADGWDGKWQNIILNVFWRITHFTGWIQFLVPIISFGQTVG